ncbi:MAG: glycoside hydrolase family 2 protein, partial [Lachnospiraceae bacterium]|nr:glycoside hydrolase family 2 protein [Lachnospiraceae bacterium]
MENINCNIKWKMKVRGCDGYYPATVPGSVYNDLINAGVLEDPYWRDNEDAALKLMDNDFEYFGTFDVDEAYLADGAGDAAGKAGADEVILRFEGLDTIADITLNGESLAHVNNMHRTWEYPVKHILKEKDNKLVIVFHSPVKFIAKEHEKDPGILGTEDAMVGFPKIRKGHYMFGWDWGPRLPDAGIWRPVTLLAVRKARLDNVYLRQEFSDDYKAVKISATGTVLLARDFNAPKEPSPWLKPWRIIVTVIDPDGNKLYDKEDIKQGGTQAGASGFATGDLIINDPKLWWPSGLGAQPLYTVTVELADENGDICDSWSRRIGLRKLEMSTAKDEYGSEFAHVVNGVKFFAMGADYIPEDNILSRTNRERTFNLLKQCAAAHFNCIRVWGGGLYPSDDFYDACDELGLVVWQDFMFACANYRLTDDFEKNILAELKDNIRRLRHHASLGLWCGNNEMEQFAGEGHWGADDDLRRDYLKMYEDLFPKLVKEEDPDRFYWPASPSCGGGFDSPNDPDRGDVHYWDVWHGNKPFTEYRKFYFRYLSEFGFQSFPSMKTVESFTLPEDRNVFSHIMEKHQRNASANGKIMNYLEQMFLYPRDLATLIYASQLLQAEAIRYGVEHFRRNRGRCMGTVYWQLNDCWPVASWSSIDYYGRWKALHYYAKRFFAPVMISCEEEGLLTQTLNVNAEPFPVKKSIRLSVANESMNDFSGTVNWQLHRADGSIIKEESHDVRVTPMSALWLDKVEFDDAVLSPALGRKAESGTGSLSAATGSLYDEYVSYQLSGSDSDEVISEGTVLFCPPKHFKFADPKLTVRLEGDEIVVTAAAFAKSVEIRNENDDLILSDNFFDM